MPDHAQLDADLQRLIDSCRDVLESEMAALDGIEAELRARLVAGQRFLTAFGHLAPEDTAAPAPQQQPDAFARLADDLAAALRRQHG